MKVARHKVADVIGKKILQSGLSKKVAKETAAYLLSQGLTKELESLVRDIQQYWADQGIINVTASSAFPIDAKVKSDIEKEVRKVYPGAKRIIINEQIDPNIISGLRLELANERLDLSAAHKLDEFKYLTLSGRS